MMSAYTGQYIFSWSIENFLTYFFESDKQLKSPEFHVEPFKGTKWMVLCTKSSLAQNRYVSWVLQRSASCNKLEKLEVSYTVELIGSSRKLYSCNTAKTKVFAKGNRVALISDTCINRLIVDDEKSSGDVMTLRLVMLSKEFDNTEDTECIARTKIGADRCSFEWKFAEKKFPLRKTFPCFQEMQVALEVDSGWDDSVNVVIKRTQQASDSRFLQCTISFADADGSKIGSRRSAGWFPPKGNEWTFRSIITKNFLKQQYATNSFVTLLCECHFSNGTLPTELKYIQSDIFGDSTVHALQGDFQRMYLEKILSDVKLRVGDETFLAHKCVLCARSPVFLAMFRQNMMEKETSFVNIFDTDPKTFGMFLKFLYMGETDFHSYEDALKLLLCADKYQVLTLKEYCCSFLIADLCEKNACQILVVADMVTMNLLKSSAIRRIGAHAARIFKSADWIQVLEHHPRVASEVLSILSSELIQ